ncbi:MFS transporter [Polynucleobacter sp. SHI8]|uniref:Bug family tripartite tricarboxylate transporter substrate binding protein n=1 Tax=unclassified Polynucleobacter TaxID=2640945 RepID=UPI00249323C0|nr:MULTISPECIES: tripartite tricarboxylate transporter substrate binding protein [unclassified Polynucleobacter]BDW10844.1 MFS transporter [Polynucleobacter sp. SHI2]BDW13290.1 MFS transporter [Polynucleobacter sp. SHI8]
MNKMILLLCFFVVAMQAKAQTNYPDKNVTMIVGFPPGTATDTVARIMAERFAVKFGKPFIIDNKPGQGGSLGAGVAAASAPDGHTLLLSATAPFATNPHLYSKLNYDSRKSFAPIGLVTWLPYVMVTNPKSGINSLQDLIDKAKAEPDKYTYASIGNGATTHLMMSMFCSQAGIKMVHVPYKGSSQSQTDVIAGQVDVTFDTVLTLQPHIKAGKLKALATGGLTRTSFLPDVPTVDELGLKGFNGGAWLGLFAPAGTPKAIVERLHRELNLTMQEPEVVKKLQGLGSETLLSKNPAEFEEFIQNEYIKWGQRVKESGAKIE